MITESEEKQDLMRKVENLSSVDDVQKLKIFIAGMEAGKVIWELEYKRQSKKRNT